MAFGGVASHALAKQCSVAPGQTPRQRSRAHDAYVWWGGDKVSAGGWPPELHPVRGHGVWAGQLALCLYDHLLGAAPEV